MQSGAGAKQWWEAAPLANQPRRRRGPKQFNIDWSQPVETVRAQVQALPKEDRDEARKQWADNFVARERETGGALQTADDTVRTLARGTFIGPFLDEITAATGNPVAAIRAAISGDADPEAADYYERLEYQRAQDRAVDTEAPVLSTVGKIAGGLTGGIAAARTAMRSGPGAISTVVGGPLAAVRPMQSTAGNMAMGAGIGSAYGAAAGFGAGEGGAEGRLGSAQTGAVVGGVLGVAVPPVVNAASWVGNQASEVVSPLVARAGGTIRDLRNRVALPPMSVTGPPPNQAAQSAGEQIIANQLSRADVRPDQLRQILAGADEATQFHSTGRATNALALVDLDESLQRLAGSLGRQQPEVSNAARAFNFARQTGYTPDSPLPANANITTRQRFAPIPKDARPAGQFERVSDALRRALRIKDVGHHGHQKTARLTDEQIMTQAREEARESYGALYQAGNGVDLAPTVQPVIANWAQRLGDEPQPVARQLMLFMRQVQRAVTEQGNRPHIQRLDNVKRYIDARIEKLMPKTGPTDRYLAGILTEFKNDVIAAVDAVPTNNLGSLYRAARDQFSSRMEMREALEAGRRVFTDDPGATVEVFRALGSRGQQNLYKLGLYDGFVQNMGRKRRNLDITGVFETPRIQEVLEAVIERSSGRFANRPERFGQFIGNEQRMIATRNVTQGNSMTARNLADDEALDGLNQMIDEVRRNPSATGLAMRAMEQLLDRFFGVRPDTAAAIARMLYTTAPAQRAQILAQIEARMGPSRMAQFTQEMARYHRAITQAGAVAGGSNAGP